VSDVYLCDGLRTPFGKYGGIFATVRPDDLAATALSALMARTPTLDPAAIDEVVLGCANQAGEDNRNVARMAVLLAGLPDSVPGVTVNRLCASGLEAIGQAARTIRSGEQELVIAGGVESMTRAPFVMAKAHAPWQRAASLEDTTIGWRFVNPSMHERFGTDSMPQTAETVAREHDVSRADQDRFALSSQHRAEAAAETGWFADEICAVAVLNGAGIVEHRIDEHPRRGMTLAMLERLKGVVTPDGSVTPGNASGINDGAAVTLLASAAALERFGLTPLARVVGMASAGVAPRIMGLGPVPATRKLLAHLSLAIADFDVIEINEAFAAQVIASLRALGVDPFAGHVNPHGGAIALGHPLGASGARLALSAARDIGSGTARRALVTMCVGVGQGVSLALEAA
jgi:3-oxoadipyl-CoA thiolase